VAISLANSASLTCSSSFAFASEFGELFEASGEDDLLGGFIDGLALIADDTLRGTNGVFVLVLGGFGESSWALRTSAESCFCVCGDGGGSFGEFIRQ
jgi:hypothetical protein